MGSFGRGNPIIWDIILRNLFILLVYQRVFTFARLNPNYYYFLGRSVSPGQLILYISTGRCCVARFKPEKERELLARFIIQFITGSPMPAQVIQNELFLEEILLCSNFAKSWAAPSLPALWAQALGLQAALQQRLPKGEHKRALSAPWKSNPTAATSLPSPQRLRREGLAATQPKGWSKNYGDKLIDIFTVRY